MGDLEDDGNDDTVTFRLKLGGTLVCDYTTQALVATPYTGTLEFLLFADGATNAQSCITTGRFNSVTGATVGEFANDTNNTSEYDLKREFE